MNSILFFIRKIFPFSLKGLFFIFLSVLILIYGIFKADLATLFWGCGFLLLLLYTLLGNHLLKLTALKGIKNTIQTINLVFSQSGVFPETEIQTEISLFFSGLSLPGFISKMIIRLEWEGRKPILLKHRIKSALNNFSVTLTPKYRGKYKSTSAGFYFEDIFGFTTSNLSLPFTEYIKVFPRIFRQENQLIRISGDETTNIKKTRKINDELLEVRKYYPGDDVRRLNWKIFAHTRELFVRKGEETPPPDMKFLFILDPTYPSQIPELVLADYLDALIETIGSIIILLLDAGNTLILSILGKNKYFTFTSRQKKDLLFMLSEINWIDEKKNVSLPVKKDMHALIFSTPLSCSLKFILNTIKDREWGASLFLKNLIFPYPLRKKLSINDLLFIREKKRTKKINNSNIIAFKQALFSEIDRYKKSPWRLQDVREI